MSETIIKDCIKFKQDDVDIVITKLNVKQLISLTKADVFDSVNNPSGYQRPLNMTQVNSIYDYLLTEEHSILPTSIILAIDRNSFEPVDVYTNIVKEKFRIVDGQHRIDALRSISQDIHNGIIEDINDDFFEWEYPVNIMILNKEDTIERFVEIRSFIDINKKGRKVSTDLADNNISTIRQNLHELPSKEAVHQICSLVSKRLNIDSKSVWYQSIKEGDALSGDRLIGMSSFRLSISSMARKYLVRTYGKKRTYSKEEIDTAVIKIKSVLDEYWNTICDKWERAFNWDVEENSFRVDSDYNIQKTLGVSALHKLLNNYYNNEFNIDEALSKAIQIIRNTTFTEKDWMIGSTFSPYTSGAGHNTIKEKIINNSFLIE
jgi:DGQHR domain-containing protein